MVPGPPPQGLRPVPPWRAQPWSAPSWGPPSAPIPMGQQSGVSRQVQYTEVLDGPKKPPWTCSQCGLGAEKEKGEVRITTRRQSGNFG